MAERVLLQRRRWLLGFSKASQMNWKESLEKLNILILLAEGTRRSCFFCVQNLQGKIEIGNDERASERVFP